MSEETLVEEGAGAGLEPSGEPDATQQPDAVHDPGPAEPTDESVPLDHVDEGERDAAEKLFGDDSISKILGEGGKKQAAKAPEAPAGFTKESKEAFLKASPEVQEAMLKAYKDMQRDHMSKISAVKAVAELPGEVQETMAKILANENARNVMMWLDSDKELADYVSEHVKQFVEAREKGVKPAASTPAAIEAGNVAEHLAPFLKELEDADDENFPEIFLSNPEGLKAIVRAAAGLSAQLEEVKKLTQPVQEVAGKVKTMEERKNQIDSLVDALPEQERGDDFMSVVADVMDEKEAELKGLPLEAVFKLAVEVARGRLAIKAAEQRGRTAEKAVAAGKSLAGLPIGGNRTPVPKSDDNDAHLFERWKANQGPFQVPEE